MTTAARLAALRARNAARWPGRVALVVGGTSGLGAACATRLAASDYTVLVVGRSVERGAAVVADCAAAGGSGHAFLACDASSLAAVRACAALVAARMPHLDALVLSQGVASLGGRRETADGLDLKLALHFFSRVAFTQALLPTLRAAKQPRVLSVLSGGVHGTYRHWADDFELRTHFSIRNAADAAGFYTDAAFDSLARQPGNAGITFIHAAPGFVATPWGADFPGPLRLAVRLLQAALAMAPRDAAEFLVAPLLSEAAGGGFLVVGERGTGACVRPEHAAAREGIWAATQAVLAR